MSALRYEAPDGRVVTATDGGVIVVWREGAKVGDTESIEIGPHVIALAKDRPRTIDDLGRWYRDLRLIDLQGHYDRLKDEEQAAEQAVLDAADRFAQAKLARRRFEADNFLGDMQYG